jgi:cell division protein FtsW (lipid II flippase)
MDDPEEKRGPKRRRFRPIHLLLAVPYVAMLWVPSYNHVEPSFAGIPFFYWYQMLWILLGVAVMLPVYLYDERNP